MKLKMNKNEITSEEKEQAACVDEVNQVLTKHGFTLQAFTQPGIRLIKTPENADLSAKIEDNGTKEA